MIIYGAGMAGLLAANMLRRFNPTVREAQASLPDNHGALLRFRSDAVERATGMPFKRVTVHKAVKIDGVLRTSADLRISNMYSQKVSEEVMTRSVMNLTPGERYIAPDDFIATMAAGATIEYDQALGSEDLYACLEGMYGPVISTVPMPVMMDIVGWEDKPEFHYLPIWSYKARILAPVTRVYQTVYYPEHELPYYRASITGDQLIIEYTMELKPEEGWADAMAHVLDDFGIRDAELVEGKVSYQKYGKLLPIDDRLRRVFIMMLTNEYGIYSVGRFATWKQILMDDVVKDVNVVERFIADRDQYTRYLHWT